MDFPVGGSRTDDRCGCAGGVRGGWEGDFECVDGFDSALCFMVGDVDNEWWMVNGVRGVARLDMGWGLPTCSCDRPLRR